MKRAATTGTKAADPLHTVTFPALEPAALAWLQAVRQRHDPQASMIAPHFTLVFGVRDLPQADCLDHVAKVTQAAAPIDFRCSQVRPWAGLGDADVHLFLVPEQGRVAIADLHDRLYQGPLAPHLRTDLPYLPHITLGRVQTAAQAQALCDELNAQLPPLGGRLGALTVGALHARRFEPRAWLPLCA